MNEQQNVNNPTPPKPKKKRSFWWLKLLFTIILLVAAVIAGMLLTAQPIMRELRDEILDEFFPQYRYAVTEVIEVPAPTPLPTEKPVEYKASPTPAPKPSKAPVEIISPEQQEKAEVVEKEEKPEVTTTPEPVEATDTALPLQTPAAVEAAPNTEYIGIDAALEAALEHAGLLSEEVFVYSVSRERDDGLVFYDVEFGYDGKEYEYEINAFSGTVESWKTDRADREDAAVAAASDTALDISSCISVEDAKGTALMHAGYRESSVHNLSTSLEIENNKLLYDIEFSVDGYDYDYKVDAVSGLIFMVEKERD